MMSDATLKARIALTLGEQFLENQELRRANELLKATVAERDEKIAKLEKRSTPPEEECG